MGARGDDAPNLLHTCCLLKSKHSLAPQLQPMPRQQGEGCETLQGSPVQHMTLTSSSDQLLIKIMICLPHLTIAPVSIPLKPDGKVHPTRLQVQSKEGLAGAGTDHNVTQLSAFALSCPDVSQGQTFSSTVPKTSGAASTAGKHCTGKQHHLTSDRTR